MRVAIVHDGSVAQPEADKGADERLLTKSVLSSVALVEEALRVHDHDVRRVAYEGLDEFLGHDPDETDVIFNLVDSIGGSDAKGVAFVGLLDLLGVPYTGNGLAALSLSRDKHRAKGVMRAYGVRTVPGWLAVKLDGDAIVTPDDKLRFDPSDFPLIVKPSRADASAGISQSSVCRDADALRERVEFVLSEFGPALIEQFIEGREFHVSVVGDGVALPVSEIKFTDDAEGEDVLTKDAKWDEESDDYARTVPECPAKDCPESVSEMAVQAYKAMGCRDYARVDMRMSEDGTIVVLEINPNPAIDDCSGLVLSARAAGKTFDELIEMIVGYAKARGEKK
ncbi:MAG: ATP-grasp domain-containing protein [Polyangiales bacterium]